MIATASRPQSQARVLQLGAQQVIDHCQPLGEGLAAAGLGEVDYAISLTHTDQHCDDIVAALKPQSRPVLG